MDYNAPRHQLQDPFDVNNIVTTLLELKAPQLLPADAGGSLVHEPEYLMPRSDRG